jgi:hypothetical protein
MADLLVRKFVNDAVIEFIYKPAPKPAYYYLLRSIYIYRLPANLPANSILYQQGKPAILSR